MTQAISNMLSKTEHSKVELSRLRNRLGEGDCCALGVRKNTYDCVRKNRKLIVGTGLI